MGLQQVLRDALALSEQDRERLVFLLHRSLEDDDQTTIMAPDPWDAWELEWSAEIKKRLSDLAEGRVTTYSHDEVMARLRARLAK